MTKTIRDADSKHWVYKAPERLQPFLQLARYDRPVGYWLLALPGWIGLAFAAIAYGFSSHDLKWAGLIFIGAVAMRGAGCTYNDIVDRDLDAQVDRTALRPLPAGAVSIKQAWVWLFAQCGVGFLVLLCLPLFAQIIALCSIPLVAAYPFMKRITWWPQIWLGMTFNWAVLVAYAAKTGTLTPASLLLYLALIVWTVGYDTIYACQDMEDDAMVGIKSTALRLGKNIRRVVALCFTGTLLLMFAAIVAGGDFASFSCGQFIYRQLDWGDLLSSGINPVSILIFIPLGAAFYLFPVALHFAYQIWKLDSQNPTLCLELFKSNFRAGLLMTLTLIIIGMFNYMPTNNFERPCNPDTPMQELNLYKPLALTPS